MEEIGRITIVTVCDNQYVRFLAALIVSLQANHHSGEPIDLYVIEDKISKENKAKLAGSINREMVSVTWMKMSDVIASASDLPMDDSTFPLNIYVRLFIPWFIPSDITKVLYLDVDMIVVKDVSELWTIDLEGKVIGGVPDRAQVVSNPWGGIRNYKELGLDEQTKYFNSGMLLMDPVQWREQDITAKVIRAVNENLPSVTFPDQYGLNVVFADQWKEIDHRWNCYANSEDPDPFIIHFIGVKPIYKSYKYNKDYQAQFYRYLGLTNWKNDKPIGEFSRYLKKMYNKLSKKFK
ncbi:glycosyltransferase family 8 protein [Hufsiella ginkgonis]|uniref:Glycosyltransferase family 8 protein n=1 Tax=Hufsiella ginkgonis TaxID=2695274 RepID=A0A7K1XZL9_9SPHI|nr:glycosyltransferase family 8 protein [Hufsiella ginkgonis]MXV16169.1 glycosyltransferase family 8 protein [Hufsiella ginkgonis]